MCLDLGSIFSGLGFISSLFGGGGKQQQLPEIQYQPISDPYAAQKEADAKAEKDKADTLQKLQSIDKETFDDETGQLGVSNSLASNNDRMKKATRGII